MPFWVLASEVVPSTAVRPLIRRRLIALSLLLLRDLARPSESELEFERSGAASSGMGGEEIRVDLRAAERVVGGKYSLLGVFISDGVGDGDITRGVPGTGRWVAAAAMWRVGKGGKRWEGPRPCESRRVWYMRLAMRERVSEWRGSVLDLRSSDCEDAVSKLCSKSSSSARLSAYGTATVRMKGCRP